MNIKNMTANIDKFGHKINDYDMIALESKTATSFRAGDMRWLDDKQEIQFDNPQFKGKNAEFSIADRSYQKIWFSQLSSRGVKDDLQSPLLDEIVFKGQPPCLISKKYRNALSFWNDTKGKKFKVEFLGNGFTLNLKNDLVVRLRMPAMGGARISNEAADQNVYDYIRNAVNNGKTSEVLGTLKNKKAYRLIEI